MKASDSFGTVTEHIAREFHAAYERYAPDHDWQTQLSSRAAWEDVPDNNKALMIAVVKKLVIDEVIVPGPQAVIKE